MVGVDEDCMDPLARALYSREPVAVARELIGKRLVRTLSGFQLVGVIVETEAYGGRKDPASHACIGITNSNKTMFGPPGFAYVYFTYGNHFCLNVVAKAKAEAGAVLIRALEPIREIEMMAANRGIPEREVARIARGPGNLTKAFSITKSLDGHDLTTKGELYITEGKAIGDDMVAVSARIGIRKEGLSRLWRFYVKENPCVTRA